MHPTGASDTRLQHHTPEPAGDPEPLRPTLAAARQRIGALNPERYARTRNALDGAVSGLSPYERTTLALCGGPHGGAHPGLLAR